MEMELVDNVYGPHLEDLKKYKKSLKKILEVADKKILEGNQVDEQGVLRVKNLVETVEVSENEAYPEVVRKAIAYSVIYEMLRDNVPSVVEGDLAEKGRMQVNYESICGYLNRKYCPVVFKKTYYIYVDGFYSDNSFRLESEVKRLVMLQWPAAPTRRLNGIVDEVMKRILWDRSVRDGQFPFNRFAADFIPLQNGVYWLEDKILLPHSPYFLFTYKLPHELDVAADCPRIEQFFREIVDERNVRALYEIPALAIMQNSRYPYAYMLVGDGSNGKSTYLNLITALLGEENVSHVSLQDLCVNRFKSAELVGKLANIFPDIPSKALRTTSIFKAITGDDAITVELKFKDPFDFRFQGRLVFSANQPPEVDDDSFAFWRRWILIEFPNTFRENTVLLDELKSELPGFLNKVLRVMEEIKEKGITKTGKLEEVIEEWRSRASSVYAFVRKRLMKDKDSEVSKDMLYEEYVNFCDDNDLQAVAKNAFGMQLQRYVRVKTVQKRVEGVRKRFWQGIRLLSEEEALERDQGQKTLGR